MSDTESEKKLIAKLRKKATRIMVVDDDMDMASLVRLVAQNEGLFVSIKKGGLSALSFLHDLNYDLDAVIIDLSLPDMDGITLTKQIRQNEELRSKRTPIKMFWFTSWPFEKDDPNDPIMLGAKENGIENVFTKQHDLPAIIREVKATLGSTEGVNEQRPE